MKALEFQGNGFEYFKIWIVNILLTIVTLGLYFPWAKVRNLRYIYGNTTLEGRNFDYHATGKQLFISYLIAMGLFILYTIIQNISLYGGLVVFAIFFLAIPWIIVRSLMFKMRVTSFSNVRFNFDGSIPQAYINFFLLPLAFFLSIYLAPIIMAALSMMGVEFTGAAIIVLVILGIGSIVLAVYLFALLKKRNTSFILNGTSYGQSRFNTSLSVGAFIKILLKTIAISIILIVAYIVLLGVVASVTIGLDQLQQLAGGMSNPEASEQLLLKYPLFIGVVYLGMLICMFIVFAYSYSRQRNYVLNNTTLGEAIPFESTVTAKGLVFVMMTNFLLVIFTLGFAFPWAQIRMAKYILANTLVDTSSGFDDFITQQTDYQSSLGDQIGDTFDIDVGVGF